MSTSAAMALAVVLGKNCKRIRSDAGVTQNGLALSARDVGLRWNAAKVGDFEAGRAAPTLATVLAVSLALTNACRRDVTLADLLDHDGFVELTDKAAPLGSKLVAVARGGPWRLGGADDKYIADDLDTLLARAPGQFGKAGMLGRDVERMRRRSGLDEDRLAKRLGIDANRLIVESFLLWERPFGEERDRRAGPGANPQQRGQVARKLQAQLQEALQDGHD